MKLHLPLSLLALACACVPFSSLADTEASACNITFVGDSITQGGTWGGAGQQASYRWQFFKILVDQGVEYNPMGTCNYSSRANGNVPADTWSYRGTLFDNTHEAAASARSYTFAGAPEGASLLNIQPNSRDVADRGTVWNFLGLVNPYTGDSTTYWNGVSNGSAVLATYSQPTYAERYGETKPDTLCVMIGINDLYSNRPDEETIAYTQQIVQAYQQYNPNIKVTVMGCLPTAPNNGTYGEAGPYNVKLQEAVATWSTDTSAVEYADVSSGISITNHYDSAGAHPNNQGELIVAGNLANALGYGQRTLGLEGKSSADFSFSGLQAGLTAEAPAFTSSGSASLGQLADSAISLTSAYDSSAQLEMGESDGWDVSSASGYTLATSVQMYALSGNTLSLQFGDGQVGDGLLTITNGGVFWGADETVLFEGSQTDMTDFRIVYMAADNASGVDAGYYVWRNNQLIGEALAGGTTMTDGLSLSSSESKMTYAAISDISWENDSTWCSDVTNTIASSHTTLQMGVFDPGDGKAYLSGTATDWSSKDAWATGSQPTADDTLCLSGDGSFSLSSAIEVKGIEVREGVTLDASSSSSGAVISVGEDGISLAAGSNVSLQRVEVAASQEWKVAEGTTLRIGKYDGLEGQVEGSGKQVTVSGGGTVLLASAALSEAGSMPSVNWVVTDGSSLRAIRNTVGSGNLSSLGAGSITLDNGTLGVNFDASATGAANQGNWMWGNQILVGNGGGTLNMWVPTNGAANRYLLYSGSIALAEGASADQAVLRLSNAAGVGSADKGFIFAGDNSAYTGKLVVGENVYLRVGAASATATGTGTVGTLTSGVIENEGTISLTRTDAWTVAAHISGSGVLNVGLTNAKTPNQVVTLTGTNTYTGATTIHTGTMVVQGSIGTGSSTNTYQVAKDAHLQLSGSGSIANKGVSLTAAVSPKARTTATGDLTNVLVTETGISRVDDSAVASLENAVVDVTAASYTIADTELKSTAVQMGAGELTLSGVTLDAASSITGQGAEQTLVSLDNVTFTLGSIVGSAGDAADYGLSGTVFVYDLSSVLSNASYSGSLTLDATGLADAGVAEGYTHTVYDFGSGVDVSALNFSLKNNDVVTALPSGVHVATGVVPEPTTATLSLLALAGLLARRRRK